jgi:hypothetical protein
LIRFELLRTGKCPATSGSRNSKRLQNGVVSNSPGLLPDTGTLDAQEIGETVEEALLAAKGHQRQRQQLPRQRMAQKVALAVQQAGGMGGANNRGDTVTAVGQILAAAEFPGHCEAGGAINILIIAHGVFFSPGVG